MLPFIVSIGASAGGLQALQEYFTHRQTTSGEAYVIILHSVRTYQSKLVDILSRITSIRIQWISDGLPLEPDNIYVCPSSHKVELANGVFRLFPRAEEDIVNFTINHFFESLAAEAKDKAIGVIMSGTGTDGTKGSQAIEKQGGTVIVQNPQTAQFDGMPLTSIRYDHPDYIRSPKEMPGLIDLIISGNEDRTKRKEVSLSAFD